jgi:SAM-dependent methyltransferase
MGVDAHVLRFLLEAKRNGVSFDSVLMVGRQHYWQFETLDVTNALRSAGIAVEDNALLATPDGYVEPLLGVLGATRTESIDCSDFEGATIVHDLNEPVPNTLRAAFSCVFDGGAIEHVFNFPQAIKNCMEMVAPGGTFLSVTTANNFMGHGFYQFSPELFYRVFSKENGFAIDDMLLSETDPQAPWYRVADPRALGRRVELTNTRPTYLMIRSHKLREAEIFAAIPQQSDYVTAWSSPITETAVVEATTTDHLSLKRIVPEFIKRPLRKLFRRTKQVSAFDSPAFTRL